MSPPAPRFDWQETTRLSLRALSRRARQHFAPPAKISSPASPPIAEREAISRVPSLSTVGKRPPPALLAPDRMSVPRPDFTIAPWLVSGEETVTASVGVLAA